MVVENERDIVRSNDDDDVDGDRPSVRPSLVQTRAETQTLRRHRPPKGNNVEITCARFVAGRSTSVALFPKNN